MAKHKFNSKSALKSIQKYMKGGPKYNKTKHYSSFWMDDYDKTSKFAGFNSSIKSSAGSDIVKLVKLVSYQRAISNFVKIVTNKDIPVSFGGGKSYTDGDKINITTDISDKNFDVVVGLALHEAAHVKLSSFTALENLANKYNVSKINPLIISYSNLKDVVNIIEDRRIDNFIFKTSPGYKAYYHKMYDHYFHSDIITKALISSDVRNPQEVDHYLFRICNFSNPASDLDALPNLRVIYNMINIPNIGRLKSTDEVVDLGIKVCELLSDTVRENKQQQNNNSNNTTPEDSQGTGDEAAGDKADSPAGEEVSDSTKGNASTLSPDELVKLGKAIQQQNNFINGDVKKKGATLKLQKQLDKVTEQGIEVQMVGDERSSHQCIIYNFTTDKASNTLDLVDRINELVAKHPVDHPEVVEAVNQLRNYTQNNKFYVSKWGGVNIKDLEYPEFLTLSHSDCESAINAGLELGGLLGKKLVVRNEEKSLVYNRLLSGKIDNKRLAHAGYGIETVFNQTMINKYKKANLHISLDASGSMSGKKWLESIKMTAAIVKAATYITNLNIQVDVRTTISSGRKQLAAVAVIYDSRVNNVSHFRKWMGRVYPFSMTPEGLCFDGLHKRGKFVKGSKDIDSYFLNISDGLPGMHNLSVSDGVRITKSAINRMKQDNIQILSFYVEDRPQTLPVQFTTMYGKDAKIVSADSVTDLARELNSKFLSEGIIHA